ncbi:hypothetical protein D5038_14650 [Verminephrobacter aporrectodeae subsp. tuberculatae]|uniref:hypothetical protein n=1 Tax=Verminephrobacter aporrectodeae TaxID=1110389 RepID=UPI00223889A9|nr:hypothetical protein [Verminephrobacter aporrectodeae]MCW5257557.1 hypothetical protein [Verminephrobacter aporrectodeae subsp. tuberculatae]
MRPLRDPVWQRHGISWIWNAQARNQLCTASEVWSLRQFLQAVEQWPRDLPSKHGNTLVVGGLDGSLDLLTPDDAETWLGEEIKEAILSFQSHYQGETALIFWLPCGQDRIKCHPATDSIEWRCAAPDTDRLLPFGRILWGEANEYPQEIFLRDGSQSAGLFHRRIT